MNFNNILVLAVALIVNSFVVILASAPSSVLTTELPLVHSVENYFTLIYKGFGHYDHIISQDANASFLATMEEIVKQKQKTHIIQNLVLHLRYFEFFSIREKDVSQIVRRFRNKTKIPLKYVLLPSDTPEDIVGAFAKRGVSIIYLVI